MSGRLLSWPNGVGVSSWTIVSGPVSSGGSESASISGIAQHISGPKSPWVFELSVPPMQGEKARRFNGMLTAAHAGANAISLPWSLINEPINPLSIGLSDLQQLNWSNGQPWSNGQGWSGGYPLESVSADQSKDYSTVTLGNDAWGDHLQMGDWFGFVGHYGVYTVTGEFPLDDGKVRIWPPLRKAITTSDEATLEPVLIVRTVGAPTRTKSPGYWEGGTIQIVEIPNDAARTHYTLP